MAHLDFPKKASYNALEAYIHLNRYAFARPFCEGTRILDAACGQGYGSYLMKTWGAKEVTGIDIDAAAIAQASALFREDGLHYLQHTVEQLPFPDASFDVVVSFETIEHIDKPDAFLKEIKRVLRPGGIVVISCPNDNYYYQNDCTKNPSHKAEYTYFQFKELTEKLQNRLDAQEKENLELQQSLEAMKNARDIIQQQVDGLMMSNARMIELLTLTRKERDQLQEYADQLAWFQARWESMFFIRAKRLLIRILNRIKRTVGKDS